MIRGHLPKAFRRNYHICSTGKATYQVLDQYVANQTAKHVMADPVVQARLERFQFHDESVELSIPRISTHGEYCNSLQVVLENAGNWRDVREKSLQRMRDTIVSAAKKKAWRLSRIGMLSDHLHILLGVGVTESPQTVALSLMNNLAYSESMKPVLKYSYYAGTFGGYDRYAASSRFR